MTVVDHAIDLYRGLRKQGITIKKPYDCLIASFAILEDMYLLHNDSDFRQMENNSKLKVYSYKEIDRPIDDLETPPRGFEPRTQWLTATCSAS